MRKLCTILILMFLVLGVSSAFAQDDSVEEVAVASSGGGSSGSLVNVQDRQDGTEDVVSSVVVTQPTVSSSGGAGGNLLQISPTDTTEVASVSSGGGSGFSISSYAYGRCAVDNEKLDRLHRLVTQIREVSEVEDRAKYDELDMQIRKLSQEVKEYKQRCLESEEVVQEVTVSSVVTTEMCDYDKNFEKKITYYKKLHELSNEELKEKGFQSKEEVENIIDEINKEWVQVREMCESKVQVSTRESMVVKPVTAEDAVEITEYYKRKMDRIVVSGEDTSNKVYELKELRMEIDKLIESLLKSKDEIRLEEISSIVETVQIRPGVIEVDNVIINTVNKKMVIRVNEKDLKIIPIEKQVVIQDENLEIKALELNIESGVLKVGNSEVRLTASDVITKIGIEPKEIELKEENARAVYKIKIDENRKLFGFIPVKVEKDLIVDATSVDVGIIKEELAWWGFMTTSG